jgi:rhodanese-related sulfurtransferase
VIAAPVWHGLVILCGLKLLGSPEDAVIQAQSQVNPLAQPPSYATPSPPPSAQGYAPQQQFPAPQFPAQQYPAQQYPAQPYPPQTGQGGYPAPYPNQGGYPATQGPYPNQGGYPAPPQTAYPNQGNFPAQQPAYPGQPPNAASGAQQLEARLEAMMPEERRDLGVPPTGQLHPGAPHGPTPNQIPGGQVITTKGVVSLMQGAGVPFLLLDVLGSGEVLPGALPAAGAAAPGSFQDQTQQQFGQFLSQATQRRTDMPLVFYCQGINCWMSYNAALRAIHLGYKNVLWYRGGLEAWKLAGLPTQSGGGQQLPQGMPQGVKPQQPFTQ